MLLRINQYLSSGGVTKLMILVLSRVNWYEINKCFNSVLDILLKCVTKKVTEHLMVNKDYYRTFVSRVHW